VYEVFTTNKATYMSLILSVNKQMPFYLMHYTKQAMTLKSKSLNQVQANKQKILKQINKHDFKCKYKQAFTIMAAQV
jgi:TATA-box binding protein (TBP) (component of TFIID and TFIIIB)